MRLLLFQGFLSRLFLLLGSDVKQTYHRFCYVFNSYKLIEFSLLIVLFR